MKYYKWETVQSCQSERSWQFMYNTGHKTGKWISQSDSSDSKTWCGVHLLL